MQPYFFPYIGYFDLLASTDIFVAYDDADFSKNGWINRNRIASNVKDFNYIRLTAGHVPLGTPINAVRIKSAQSDLDAIKANIYAAYRKAPYFGAVAALIDDVFSTPDDGLASLATRSVSLAAARMDIKPTVINSSTLDYDRSLTAAEKIISICKGIGADTYVNLSGGRELYDVETFARHGLSLQFTTPCDLTYSTGDRDFVPNLSIIDAMMWASPETLSEFLHERADRLV